MSDVMLRSGRKHVVVSRKVIDDQAFTLIGLGRPASWYNSDKPECKMSRIMTKTLKIFRTMLILIATFVTGASCDESLKLELRILGTDYCQFTSTAQVVTVKTNLNLQI